MKTKMNIKHKWGVAGGLALGLAMVLPLAGSASAWGPERQTYTNQSPADHVQFNSITDNAAIKDERDFVRVSEDNGDGKYTWTNNLKIEAGKKYAVMIYYHNNAASNLNDQGIGMATNTRVASKFPSTVNSSKKGEVYAEISADNASPKTVWDEAYFTTDSQADIVLRYVAASAKIYNSGQTNGTTLSDAALFSAEGHLIGFNQLIGNLPGCAEYSGQIMYSVYATQVGSKVEKTVSVDGVNFGEKVNTRIGSTITYKVTFTNTGSTDLTNVTFRDKLPAGVSLIPGTTKLVNAANPDGVKMVDLIGQNGFATGTYGPGATAILTYQVKVEEEAFENMSCGEYELNNQIIVAHDEGEISDESIVKVVKECAPGETPNTPSELPTTGPAEVLLAVVAVICVTTGIAYWYHSQKEVAKVTKKIKGKK